MTRVARVALERRAPSTVALVVPHKMSDKFGLKYNHIELIARHGGKDVEWYGKPIVRKKLHGETLARSSQNIRSRMAQEVGETILKTLYGEKWKEALRKIK